MIYALPVIIVFAASFFVSAVFMPPLDGDLAWQRWLGAQVLAHGIPGSLGAQTYSAPGAPWVAQEWAFSVAAFAGSRGAAKVLFELFTVACAVATLGLVAWRCERRACSPLATMLATLLVGMGISESFGVRAQVVAWPLLAALLLMLEMRPPRYLFAALLVALWSNLHGSVMLAPVLAGVFAVASALEEGALSARVRGAIAFCAVALIAVCMNPLGLKLPLYAIDLFSSPIRLYIDEWRPPSVHHTSLLFADLPMMAGICVVGMRGSGRWFDRLLFAVFTVLVLSSGRHMAVFAIALAPAFAQAMTQALAPLLARSSLHGRLGPALLVNVAAIAIAIAIVALKTRDPDLAKVHMPLREVAILAHTPGEQRVMCADFAWCSHLLAVPNARTFLDGRADPFPPTIWELWAQVAYLRPQWQEALTQTRTNAVIVTRGATIDQALAQAPEWRTRYRDRDFTLYLLRSPGPVLVRVQQRP